MKLKLFVVFLLFLPCLIFADRAYAPWYTGPLLADNGTNTAKGMIDIQPYLYFRDTNGVYNKSWGHGATPSAFTFHAQLEFEAGITKWFDIKFIGNALYKDKEGKKSFEVGDTTVELGFQLLRDKIYTITPAIRLTLIGSFPTGKYKNLNPNKLGIDSSGSGSYETIFGFVVEKVVYWFDSHPIRFRLNPTYTYSPKVSVKNFNTYGGGFNTNGKVSPGGFFSGIVSFEFSFTQRWVFAMDIAQTYSGKTTFKGIPGTNQNGSIASNTKKNSNQTSIAPAIEYNFSANLGMLAGGHFSLREKNATDFKSGIISATYTF
ncbi:MAG: hypothetical protein K1060chlam4_00693 [Candidatus Anoxychlamydiales bacterium]|nr:hypothetical protein [Candidatus Anoxychlamydiales bacterium]